MKSHILRVIEDVWNDRRLLIALSAKDFKRKFSGTYFGVFWAVAQPLLTIIVYWVAFQYGFHSNDVNGIPYVVWFICGIVPWLFINEAISMASNSFIEYSYLIKKVKFNISILPLVKILSSFYIHIFFCIILLVVSIGFGIYPSIYTLQIIYYMLANIILIFAITLITSSIVVFFRDLNQLISVILLIGMWGTPIAWNLEGFSPTVHIYFKMNPFYYIIEGYRNSILGRAWLWQTPRQTVYFWVVTIILLIIGGTVYSRLKPHFADTV